MLVCQFDPASVMIRIACILSICLCVCWCTSPPVAGDGMSTCTDCSCAQPVVNCKMVCLVCNCTQNTADCRALKLKDSFSSNLSQWAKFSEITEMNLQDNQIGRIVTFPPLNLTTLSLENNLIQSIDAKAFINLKKLEDLDLSHNLITTPVLAPEVFEGAFSPEYYEPLPIISLNLSFNELSDLHQDTFMHLPQLQRLSLRGNPLGDANGHLKRNTVVAIAGVASLQMLDLTQTGMSALPQTFLMNLKNLKELILMDNDFVEIPTDALSLTSSLQILNFNFNPIQIISTNKPFPIIPSLLQLHISFMPELKRIESNALQGLSSISYLSCAHNPELEYISPTAISASNLTRLDLHDNRLHYLPNEMVKGWHLIQYLDIRGNEWFCDCDNQWILTTLIPLHNNTEGLLCGGPEQMKGRSIADLAKKNYHMRCLDYYGNHPERDSAFLVATFVIVIVGMCAVGIYLLYRGGRCRKGTQVDYTAIYQQHVRDDPDYKY